VARNISITFNGLNEEVPENSTVAYLIEHFNEKDHSVIVEINGRYIFPQTYGTTTVSEGDKLEFINPDVGG